MAAERIRIVPYAIFTDPELGRVGLRETARRSGHPVAVGWWDMANSGEARELGKTKGVIKVVQLSVELMNAGATAHTMVNAVHIHPTLAEAAKNATLAALIPDPSD